MKITHGMQTVKKMNTHWKFQTFHGNRNNIQKTKKNFLVCSFYCINFLGLLNLGLESHKFLNFVCFIFHFLLFGSDSDPSCGKTLFFGGIPFAWFHAYSKAAIHLGPVTFTMGSFTKINF